MKLSDFAKEGDTVLDRIDYPLFRALAAKATRLEVNPDEFVLAMRYAISSDLYWNTRVDDTIFHYILGMEIVIS